MIMEKEIIKWEDFNKIDLRVGTIVNIVIFEKAVKPAFKIWVDFGYLGIKKTSAQIRKNYSKDDLIGQQIIGLINLPKKQIADINPSAFTTWPDVYFFIKRGSTRWC